jgi:hypothetical protein
MLYFLIMKTQIRVRGRSTTNYIDRWIGASVFVLSFFMAACATGPSRERMNPLPPQESSDKEKNYMRMTQNITDQATDLAAKARRSFPGMSDDDLAKKLEDQGFSIRWNPPTYDENGNVMSRATMKGVYVPGTAVFPLVGQDPSQTSNIAEAQAIASDWMKDYQARRMTPQLAQQYRDREWKLYGYGFIPGGSVYDAGITISGVPIPVHTASGSGSEVPPYLAALPSDIDPYFEKTAREWARVSSQYSISYPGYVGTSGGCGMPPTPDSYYQSILAGLRTRKIPRGGYLTAVSSQERGGICGYILREPTIHEIGAH